MQAMEGGGESKVDFTDIETVADSIDCSSIFHIVIDILGFVLFMHQQIPAILQDIRSEFDSLHTEYKDLDIVLAQTELKPPMRRMHAGRKREVKQGIRRFEKLMKTVASLQTALQLMVSEIPNIDKVILVLGSSPIRPQQVYELRFSHGRVVSRSDCDFTKNRTAEGISRKAIRVLVSKGAGSDSYGGPTKLFLLVKAPCSLNLPQHFLPKRDFRYSKKIVPFRLRVKCKTQGQERVATHDSQSGNSIDLMDSTSTESIWFQCRHVIKGLPCRTSSTEE